MKELVIGLGSNLGDREWHIVEAVRLLSVRFGEPERVSSLYETEPWGFDSANRFLNAVALFRPASHALPDGDGIKGLVRGFLETLLLVEEKLGRSRTGEGYADRTIDLDLLFYGDVVLHVPGLIVPHPLLHRREFVLKPLVEVCPDLVHPVLKMSARELHEALNVHSDSV